LFQHEWETCYYLSASIAFTVYLMLTSL
jgi:hypothetical protein